MTQEQATPAGFWDRVEQIAQRAVDRYVRAGLLNNASISSGKLTIKGGALRLQAADGTNTMYVGPYGPNDPSGNYQPGFLLTRNDGTAALVLWDPDPLTSGYTQFLGWYDRSNNAIITDDTTSGQGLARPYLPGVGYLAQARHWPTTAATTWETIWRARHPKQHPRLAVQAWGCTDTSGTTGQIQVMVNGVALGTAQNVVSGSVAEFSFGPSTVAGAFGDSLTVELQAQRTAGTGNVQCCFSLIEGRQSA